MSQKLMGLKLSDIYEKIVETTEECIVIGDLEGKIVFANEATCKLLGWKRSEIIGVRNLDLMTEEGVKQYQAKSAERVKGKLRELYEITLRNKKTGQPVHALLAASPLLNEKNEMVAMFAFISDITPQKMLQNELSKSLKRLREAQSVAKLGFWEQNLLTKQLVWSDELYDLLGFDRAQKDPQMTEFFKHVHPEDREKLERLKENADRSGTGYQFRYRFIRPSGETVYLQSAVVSEKDSQGNILLLRGILQDVTAQVKSDHLIEEQKTKMLTSSKLSALGEMAGGVAHEINTPLAIFKTTIEQALELLSEPELDKNLINELLKSSLETTDRIAKIVKGLRTFSRDADSDPFVWTAISEIVENTLSLCHEKFKNYGIQIQCDRIDPTLAVECRSVQVSQVLLNLLNNAFDAVESVSKKWVSLMAEEDGNHIKIILTDSGSGIPEAQKEKIFQPFFTTKDVGRGTGLGLSISKGIIEAHQGTLDLDLQSSNTRFVIRLPKVRTSRSATEIKSGAA